MDKRTLTLISHVDFIVCITALSCLNVFATNNSNDDYSKLKKGPIFFNWEAMGSKRVTPLTRIVPAKPEKSITLRATATPGEYEPVSFVIRANKTDLSKILLSVSDLTGRSGRRISHNKIKLQLVKCWYQAGVPGSVGNKGVNATRTLKPELLLNDLDLIRVDYAKKTNLLRITENGVKRYIEPKGKFPHNATIKDTPKLLPFNLATNRNQQVWLSIHVPQRTPRGIYSGAVIYKDSENRVKRLPLQLTVLPFQLVKKNVITTSIYYTKYLKDDKKFNKFEKTAWRTSKQMFTDLVDLREHGIENATIYSWSINVDYLKQILKIRKKAGFRKQDVYLVAQGVWWEFKKLKTSADIQAFSKKIEAQVKKLVHFAKKSGYKDVYIYGIDEAKGDKLRKQYPVWKAIHKAGGKIFVAGYLGGGIGVMHKDSTGDVRVNDMQDMLILCSHADLRNGSGFRECIDSWHAKKKLVFKYAGPQVGAEDPDIYRLRYGFYMWSLGYEGMSDFAYQYSFNNPWNDFDHAKWKDHHFTYPTSDGFINTLQWEGMREAIDDLRYLSTLLKKHRNSKSTIIWLRKIIKKQIDQKLDPRETRNAIIKKIGSYKNRNAIIHTTSRRARKRVEKSWMSGEFPPEIVTKYEQILKNLIRAQYEAGKKIEFFSHKGNVEISNTILSMNDKDDITVSSGLKGTGLTRQFRLPWNRLNSADKLGLVRALGKAETPDDHLLYGFFLFQAEDPKAALSNFKQAGKEGYKLFKILQNQSNQNSGIKQQ